MDETLLKQLIERMDILIGLSIPKYDKASSPFGGFAAKVLEYCDSENTVQDIVRKTGKNRSQVDNNLSKLRNENLIKSITKDNKTYYIRLR